MADLSSFMDLSISDANDTVVIPVPEGEYTAVAEEPVVRQWTSQDGTKSGIALDLQWVIDDQAVKTLLGRDKVTVKQGLMLDLNEQGGLDTGKGKNVGLGRLREACGLNVAGQPFSFRMLGGQVAKVAVKHRPDKNDTSVIYAEVKGVAKLT
jgi:hypothetical protein